MTRLWCVWCHQPSRTLYLLGWCPWCSPLIPTYPLEES